MSLNPLDGQAVLITGGSGSFGQAFTRRCLESGVKKVVIFSRGESKQAEMRSAFADDRLRFVIGDIRDATRIMDACRGIDTVIHAAAAKRIEMGEDNPNEFVASNITGTQNVARACIERGVRSCILLSTDKASSANTLYGMTKAVAERVWLSSNVYSAGTPTRFSSTRYGNVVGSTGSVVPLWKSQVHTGVLSVTDARMTRFLQTMDQAVDLVLLALRDMRGGDLFVPLIGAASILALAKAVGPHCHIREIGIRPGEKLHETLITDHEARSTYDAGSHYVIDSESRTWGDVPPLPYPKVPADFSYRSDTVPPLTHEQLLKMIA